MSDRTSDTRSWPIRAAAADEPSLEASRPPNMADERTRGETPPPLEIKATSELADRWRALLGRLEEDMEQAARQAAEMAVNRAFARRDAEIRAITGYRRL